MNKPGDVAAATKTSRWPKVAAAVGAIAAVAGLLGNVDKIGKFFKDWVIPSKPPAPPTVIVQITAETLLEAAARAAAVASTASGSAKTEAIQGADELRKVARNPQAHVAATANQKPPKWLVAALGELGQTEVVGEQDNPRILEYLKSVSISGDMLHDETPWTSAFANWALAQAGVKGTGSANPQGWLNWGRNVSEPKLGALVLVKRSAQMIGPSACFFLSETQDSVLCIGGNFYNSVSIRAARKEDVVGYRWPGDA